MSGTGKSDPKPMNMKVTGTNGEPTIVILLNVRARKLTSKCLCLYT